MSQSNEIVQMFIEQMKKTKPGMPEKDIINIAQSASILGIYSLGPDSHEKAGVPKGQLIDFNITSEKIYPGSFHVCKLYIPAGYDPSKAYPYTLFLDGVRIYLTATVNANIVLDNLIADGCIPAMLAIFLDPGDNGEGEPYYGGGFVGPVSNRSREYDSIDDNFVRFLTEELLPKVKAEYNLTDDPDMHCICGSSTAANGAFNAAWLRPDLFRKVICHVGNFTPVRGGNQPDRIRKNYPKPLRVFLQDGENDLNCMMGDLVLANKEMASALEYRGYDYKYVLGKGGHSLEHAGSILPETLEWIWR